MVWVQLGGDCWSVVWVQLGGDGRWYGCNLEVMIGGMGAG